MNVEFQRTLFCADRRISFSYTLQTCVIYEQVFGKDLRPTSEHQNHRYETPARNHGLSTQNGHAHFVAMHWKVLMQLFQTHEKPQCLVDPTQHFKATKFLSEDRRAHAHWSWSVKESAVRGLGSTTMPYECRGYLC